MGRGGDSQLVGAWSKQAGSTGGGRFAATLRFEPQGQYYGATDPPGEFTWLDGGSWHTTDAETLELSTANDAVVPFRYTVERDRLTLVGPDGCRVEYTRG